MKVRSINLDNKSELQEFISLERKLLSHHKNFVSSIDDFVMEIFTGNSHLYKEVEFKLFIVSKEKEDIGRCAAIINKKYQRDKKESVGSIGYFAAIPHCEEGVKLMMQKAETWLVGNGISRIIAPWDGINAADSLCVRPKDSPLFPIPWHPEYYEAYLINCGYKVKHERLNFTVDFSCIEYLSNKEKYEKLTDYAIRSIDKTFWDRDIEIVRKLFNVAFKNEWECYQYTSEEFSELFEPLKEILDPNHFLIAQEKGKPIGFCFGVADLTPLFRSFKGVFESNQLEILVNEAKNYKRAAAFGIGVLSPYKGKGIAQSLVVNLFNSYENQGLKSGNCFLVNDYNMPSIGLAQSLGGKGKVISKCFDKITFKN